MPVMSWSGPYGGRHHTSVLVLMMVTSVNAFSSPAFWAPMASAPSLALRSSGRPGLVSLKSQLKQNVQDPLKNERGNNIGDPRYTTSYTEDLKEEVEDLPAGTTAELIADIALKLKASDLPGTLESGRIKYRNHFIGEEVVDWMIKQRIAKDRRVAVAYGRMLIRQAEIVHCNRGHDFKDEPLFYRFVSEYEKGLINPKTPYQYVMRLLANPPILLAGVIAFLFVANVAYVVQGGQ